MRFRSWVLVIGLVAVLGCLALAQAQKPASPAGTAATQVGGKYVQVQNRQRYQGGKWIEISYGRPIKRERQNLFGAGDDYGKTVNDGSPVWRAGPTRRPSSRRKSR